MCVGDKQFNFFGTIYVEMHDGKEQCLLTLKEQLNTHTSTSVHFFLERSNYETGPSFVFCCIDISYLRTVENYPAYKLNGSYKCNKTYI